MGQRTLNLLHWSWLAAILVAALVLRSWHLDYPALSIDEAESGINALSILERGYPADEYLGQPIFENTLVRPWPGGHEEYEFRDISYSDRGMAVYHGWLPLYAIAGSYWVAGQEPDAATDPPRVQTTPDEVRLRTVAARVPAVIFGLLGVVVAYVAGRCMSGRDAGLVAATMVALAPPLVRASRDARYYSAAHALGLLSCFAIWLMASKGRWRDYILGAVSFALLFHTHAITFAVAAFIWLGALPLSLRRPRSLAKIGVFVAVLALAIVPWVVATGFPGEASGTVPAARQLLDFPADYLSYFARHWKLTAVLVAGGLTLAGMYVVRGRLPERVTEPFVAPRVAIGLLLAWLVAGYLTFLLIVPAPSAFLWRSTLAVQAQGILLVAILIAAVARVAGVRAAAAVPYGVGVAMLLLPSVREPLRQPPQWNQPVYVAIEYLRQQEFAPGTRIYASPLNHLTLTLLSGMPIQSTAPVHKRFFDEYEGDIVILETAYRGQEVSAADVHEAAGAAGASVSDLEARRWAWALSTRRVRGELVDRDVQPMPPVERLPAWLVPLAEELSRQPPRRENADGLWDNPAMFRGHETPDKWGFWQVFFYRFVDPASRTGPNLNYAARVRGARAKVLESSWIVFHAPLRRPAQPATQPASQPATQPAPRASEAPVPRRGSAQRVSSIDLAPPPEE